MLTPGYLPPFRRAQNETFIATVLKARAECADNADVLKDCCTRLQAHNRRLKEYVAIYDCQVSL